MTDPLYVELLDDDGPLDESLRAALARFGRGPIDAGDGPPGEVDHHLVSFDPAALATVENALAGGPGQQLYAGERAVVDGAGVHTTVYELYWSETVALSLEPLRASVARVRFAATQWGAEYHGLRLSPPALPPWP